MFLWLKSGTCPCLAFGCCMTFSLVSCLAVHSCQAQCFCLFCSSSGLLLLPWPISKAEEIERSVWVFMYGCWRHPSWEAKGFFCWLCLIRRNFSVDFGSSDRTRGWMPLWHDPLCCSGMGELLWGDWFYQRLFHGWHIFSTRREHQLPTCMQGQAQPPRLAGMDARQGVGGQQTKFLFCYARCPVNVEEGECCGQEGCIHPPEPLTLLHSSTEGWGTGKVEEETMGRETQLGDLKWSQTRLAYAGSSSNGSGTYSTFPESFSPSHSLSLHEMTPSVNVLRKLRLGVFLWSINAK